MLEYAEEVWWEGSNEKDLMETSLTETDAGRINLVQGYEGGRRDVPSLSNAKFIS